jgi:hypothetical protein
MSKLAVAAAAAALLAMSIALAVALHAAVSMTDPDKVGQSTEAPIDPTATMERAPRTMPAEQYDAH